MGAHYYPFLPIGLISSIHFPTEERLRVFKKPLLIIHGEKDEIIPYFMGKKMADQTKAEFLDLTGRHNSGFEVSPNYIPTLQSFVNKLSLPKPLADTP